MNSSELHLELRKFVLIKSGLRNIDPSQCKIISESIFLETKNYVSETTIKRFFGFANTIHKFSLFTLNSLSQYVGYPDWESFSQDKQNSISCDHNLWYNIKLKAQTITEIALIAKKNSSGLPFAHTHNRSFLYPDFDYFLKNNFIFTTLSAPSGHGKSILIAHLLEHFFYSEHALYKNDIVLLLNAVQFNSLLKAGITLKEWFLKEFNFGSLSEMLSYFKKNPEKKEGRFVLFVDDVDSFLFEEENFKIFNDFLCSIEDNNILKVITALRPNNWQNIKSSVFKSDFLTKKWYNGLFYDSGTNCNIPNLNTEEILQILTLVEGKKVTNDDISEQMLSLFKSPFWLQIYYKRRSEIDFLMLKNPVIHYELVNYYLEKQIFLANNSTEKTFLLKKISEAIFLKKKSLRIKKETILSIINQYPAAYIELIKTGILLEEKKNTSSNPIEVVRFISVDIYTYFVFIDVLEIFNFKPEKLFFEYILTVFSHQLFLRKQLLNWSIRCCINQNNIEPLKNILKLPFSNEEKNQSIDFICHVTNYELTLPNSKFNKQTIGLNFIDILTTARTISVLFKETTQIIYDSVLDIDLQIILLVIEANMALISVDKNELCRLMNSLKRNHKRLSELFPINPYDLLEYSYNILLSKHVENPVLDDKIIKLCRKIDLSEPGKNEEITTIEILSYRLVLITLFSQKKYVESHHFIMAIMNKYPNIFCMRNTVFSPFLLIHLGQTYLKLNYYKKAQRISQFLDKIIANEYTYFPPFIKASFHVFKANFYTATHEYDKALDEIEKGLKNSTENDFKMYQISLMLIKIEVLKQSYAPEEISTAIKELLYFLSANKISMPDYANLNNDHFDETFEILKSYKTIKLSN
ncbi:hypothetical protein [Pedobacter sp. MW01-1-1]|uniref:hypothetical protein n=1 Tax=Pedobacter sp. MW01-1-1 TaxID=3383027 RepID=UPI003FEEB4D6